MDDVDCKHDCGCTTDINDPEISWSEAEFPIWECTPCRNALVRGEQRPNCVA